MFNSSIITEITTFSYNGNIYESKQLAEQASILDLKHQFMNLSLNEEDGNHYSIEILDFLLHHNITTKTSIEEFRELFYYKG